MVVEDSETELMLLTRLAKQVGESEVASYGDPTAALASAFGEGCDLIIVDYMMPVLGGIEFIQRIRRHPRTWNVPVVMITSETDPAVKQAAIDAGATAFLCKPVNLVELRARLRNLLALRKAMIAPGKIEPPATFRLLDRHSTARWAAVALGGVLLLLSATAILGALFSYQAGIATRRLTEISNAFEQARFYVAAEESLERKYRLEPSQESRLQHRQAADSLLAALNQVVRLGDTDHLALIAEVGALHRKYIAGVADMFAAIDAGDPARASRMDVEEVDPYFVAIEARVSHAAAIRRQDAAEHLESFARTQSGVLIATPICFVLGIGLAFFFWRRIGRYRREVEDGLIREANAFRNSEQRFRALVQNACDIKLITSADGRITYQAPTNQAAWGYAHEQLVNESLSGLVHPDDRPALHALLEELQKEPGATTNVELRLRNVRGQWRYVDLILTNLLHEAGVAGIVATAREITERKAFEEQLTRQAFSDALTGLPNRALFRNRLDQALGRAARRQPGVVGLLFIDLDNFKLVNDSLGHHVGDRLLVEAAKRIAGCAPDTATVARLGGDEFVILLEQISNESDAVQVAECIAAQFREPVCLDHHSFYITASIGITTSKSGHPSAEDMLRDADVAMYRAKSAGRAGHVIFDLAMQTNALLRLELESDLRKALQQGEFCLHYQPIVLLETGEIAGVEALVRWQHPTRGLIPPADFIPIAEESGLIIGLGNWVLNEACRQVACWQKRLPAEAALTVSVNLSPRQFQHPDLFDEVARVVRDSGISTGSLKLEITEGVIMQDVEATIETLWRLKGLGIQLAIDDFGTGYSSLAYLKRLPLDVLKIDRSFVKGIERGQEDIAIVRAIISMAKSLNLSITAEGIETAEQAALLKQWECERGQGYYFARPLEAEALSVILRSSPASFPSKAPSHAMASSI
jgi:diguanylate cyclase (GGDEF)-like protein/PAS domain S-box-containing protein